MNDLAAFKEWMLSRGRAEDTANLYCRHLRQCFAERNLKSRLLSRKLSPNTKRGVLAALRAWCKFADDPQLAAELDDIKLPAPERVTEKVPLRREDWDNFVRAVELQPMDEDMRAVARMIAVRGFRVGDVCRLTPATVRQGLETSTLIYTAKSGRHLPWGIGPYAQSLEQFLSSRGWKQVADLISHRGQKRSRMRAARLNVERTFSSLGEEIGLEPGEVTPHRLRRTYAVYFLQAVDGDIVKLKDHMGWASLATAMRYVDHSQREELDKVAAQMLKRG